jgi:two-component system CheB/CheR fusion protein
VLDRTPTIEELLRLLLEQSTELAIIFADPEGRIRWWNAGAEYIFGRSQDEVQGESVTLVFPTEEIKQGFADHELAVARAQGRAEDDRWLARKDGSKFWATGVMLALRDASGDVIGFGKMLRNRTDLREQLDALQNQVVALDSSVQNKDRFLATLSHELRNPLSPLSYAVQLIRNKTEVTPELDTHLSIIERQVESLRRLIGDLMDLSRIGAGKVELQRERIALNDIIHASVQSVGPLVRERDHEVVVLLPPTPMIVTVDPVRMEQVFVNLLNNAAKYTPPGGQIWVEGTTEGREAVIHIRDTGVGISHEMLPHIFDLFTQAESSREQWDGGLGVGLALVKKLVALHGGSVQVRSEGESKGSEFSVRLALAELSTPNQP